MPRPRNNQFTKESFYFHRHDPGEGPVNNWKLQFEAHITDINDTSSPSWNDNFDMGRADPSVMYTSMNRTISVSFQVFAMNQDEHRNNHEELLAKLGKMTYPIYKGGSGYNAPHVYFQIGGLHKGYGVLQNVSYTWNGDNVWIEGRPILTDVSLTIRVLGDAEGKRPSVKSRYFI